MNWIDAITPIERFLKIRTKELIYTKEEILEQNNRLIDLLEVTII